MVPTDLRYSKEHEWIRVEDGVATLGITDFAQQELGDIVYVELPETGASFEQGQVLGTVESVKAVSEIYAPLGGEVVEVNAALTDTPETLNSDPHGEGWLCKLRVGDAAQVDTLMDAAAYEQLIAD